MSTYTDAYLAPRVTPEYEAQAQSDVDAAGTFTEEWTARLKILRVYILICMESTSAPDDTFSTKLSHYRKEYERALVQAKATKADSSGTTAVLFSIPLERA